MRQDSLQYPSFTSELACKPTPLVQACKSQKLRFMVFFFFASDLVLWGRRPYVGHFRHMLSIVGWGVCTVDV